MSLSPLLIAAYTDDFDGVVILRFPPVFVERFGLAIGMRLLTVNTYFRLPELVADIILGPAELGQWQNFYPLIAEFRSDDGLRIERRKTEIAESEMAALRRARATLPHHSARLDSEWLSLR